MAGLYTVVVNDQNGCVDSIEFEITQPAPISVDFEIDQVSCFGETDGEVKIIFENGGTAPFVHSLNQQTFSIPDLTIQGLSADVYTVLTIDDNGCEHTEELTVSEPPIFTFNLGDEQIVELGENAIIPLNINNGVGDLNYTFSPVDYIDCPNASINDCPIPTAILPIDDVIYEVTMVDENGCSSSGEVKLKVINPDENIYLGNAFNLNSGVGNEMFYIQSNAAVESVISFQIFNRWGAQVFEQADFLPNDKSYGWNGTFIGKQADVGVYIYVVDYRTIDGKVKKKMGDVVLLK